MAYDQIGVPISAIFLAEKTTGILIQLKTKEQGEKRWGVYHITESKVMSWYKFAIKIFRENQTQYSLKIKHIVPINSNLYSLSTPRPQNSVLSCNFLKENFIFI